MSNKQIVNHAIAIIGYSCRFPGANHPEAFAELIFNKKNAISIIPSERRSRSNSSETIFGGFIDNVDQFDADFFGISYQEASAMDPQHRILLELSFEAFESAGYSKEVLSGTSTGVFVGMSTDDYSRIQHDDMEQLNPYLVTAHSKSIAANRISYFYNLRGPSISIDTACSSSLTAVHLACQSLRNGESDLALAAGVNLMLEEGVTNILSDAGMLAKDGRCKVFDKNADGYVRGEGAGIVILKRYQDAIRDHDHIHSIIVGSACNQDGTSNGITAPNGLAQESVIRSALQNAGLMAHEIQYVEAHGTGTPLGDPIEMSALSAVLGEKRDPQKKCAVGSVKANIGHLEAAAGIAGLIKTTLILQRKIIPPQLHLNELNPAITDVEKNILYFPTSLECSDQLQYASVSSFGFGGTNGHVILKSHLNRISQNKNRLKNKPAIFVISAQDKLSLVNKAKQYIDYLMHKSKNHEINYLSLTNYLIKNRSHLDFRAAFVATDAKTASFKLNQWITDEKNSDIYSDQIKFNRKLVFIFSGQGAQYPKMGQVLYESNSIFQSFVLECDHIIKQNLKWSFIDKFTKNEIDQLSDPIYSQLEQVVIQIGIAKIWENFGIKPKGVIGHSLGEIPAAYVAGIFTLNEVIELTIARAKAMSSLYNTGSMLSCFTDINKIKEILNNESIELSIAVVNSHHHIVLSGRLDAIKKFKHRCNELNILYREIHVHAAFHSHMMDFAAKEFLKMKFSLKPKNENIPFYSTCHGKKVAGKLLNKKYFSIQLKNPVLFHHAMNELISNKYTDYLEICSHPILYQSIHECLTERNEVADIYYSLHKDYQDETQILNELARLYVNGYSFLENHVLDNYVEHFDLPPYPWKNQRHWFNENKIDTVSVIKKNEHISEEQIIGDIRKKLSIILNIPIKDFNINQPFIEMGTDSIVFSKMISVIEKNYQVKLSIRQFFESLSTPIALANYLSTQMIGNDINKIDNHDAEISVKSPHQPKNTNHGPLRLIQNLPQVQYSEAQSQFIHQFILKYTEKTKSSKMKVNLARNQLADSRSVAGFRPSTKELVYPIIGQYYEGSHLWDIDNNEYIDISMDFGANLFGHQAKFIKEAIIQQVSSGLGLAPRSAHLDAAAKLLCSLTGMERAVFCTTGTESVMTAIRLARLASKRSKIVVFSSSYHGHSDQVLATWEEESKQVQAVVAGVSTLAILDTMVLSYGNPESFNWIVDHAEEIAAVLVEPIQARHPDKQPQVFLKKLRQITQEKNIILIFDEMITGFRLAPGGAQAWFQIQADLATYGKILGGGCPVSAVAGRSDLLAGIDGGIWKYGDDSYPKEAMTFFAGTFNGYALGATTAFAVLSAIQQSSYLYKKLNDKVKTFAEKLNQWFFNQNIDMQIVYAGSLFRFEFNQNLDIFFYQLLEKGLFIWEGRNCFLSFSHSDDDVEVIIQKIKESIIELKENHLIKIANQSMITLAQKQLWALAKLGKKATIAYHEANLLLFEGKLDTIVLKMAWEELVNRHESLRMIIHENGEQFFVKKQIDLDWHEQIASNDDGELSHWQRNITEKEFDFQTGPLFRIGILKVQNNIHYMILVIHHIIVDGWAIGALYYEFSLIYKALLSDHVLPNLPPVQFSDYINWFHGNLPTFESQKKYWCEKLQHLPKPLFNLEQDELDWTGFEKNITLTEDQFKKIQLFARENNYSLFMFLLACYQCFLHKWFGKNSIIVGCPTLGRSMPDGDRVVAYCTHLLPIFSIYRKTDTVKSFFEQIKSTLLEAFDNQDYPYAHMLADLSHDVENTIIQTVFNLDKLEKLDFGEKLNTRVEPVLLNTVHFPLSLNVIEEISNLTFIFKFQSMFFSNDESSQFVKLFIHFLNEIIKYQSCSLNNLSIIHHDEWKAIEKWNNNYIPIPDLSINELFKNNISIYGDRASVIYKNKTYTYYEFDLLIDQLSYKILNEINLNDSEIIAIALEDKLEIIISMLAILRVGKSFVVIDTKLPINRIKEMIKACQCVYLITNKKFKHYNIFENRINYENIESIQINKKDVKFTNYNSNNLAYIVFTSGSTGTPKAVMIEHKSFINFTMWFKSRVNLTDNINVDCSSNLAFDFGLATSLAALLNGSCVHLCDEDTKFDIEHYCRYLEADQIELIKVTPSYFHLIENECNPVDYPLHSLKVIILAGEKINPEDCKKWLKKYPHHRLINCYGPTETTVSVLMHDVKLEEATIPLGRPEHNITVYLINDNLELLPSGIIGELCIGGECVGKGYLNEPHLTSQKFLTLHLPNNKSVRIYRTGDQAKLLENGELEYIGRLDDQVKIRGYRVELNEIKVVLQRYQGITDAAVVVNDNQVIAYYTTHVKNVDENKLKSYLFNNLPDYMVPHLYVKLNTIPLNRNDKLDTKNLPKPIRPHFKSDKSITAIQALIISAWKEILAIDHVSENDNFFNLGGDSIGVILLVSKLRSLGFKINAKQIYQFPTIEKLVDEIQQDNEIIDQSILTGHVRLTPIQKRFFLRGLPNQNHYNQAILLLFSEDVNFVKLQASLDYITNYHDSFRLRYKYEKNQYHQYYVSNDKADLYNINIFEDVEVNLDTISYQMQTKLDIINGPLINVAIINCKDSGSTYFIIVVHHLIMDSISWQIFLMDLFQAYDQSLKNETIHLVPKSYGYLHWAEEYLKYSKNVNHQIEFWKKQLSVFAVNSDYLVKDIHDYQYELDEISTHHLTSQIPMIYDVHINAILLSALVYSFYELNKKQTIHVMLEGHGREEIISQLDFTRTIGWFTAIYPFCLSISDNDLSKELIKKIDHDLKQIPDKGIGYGVLKYLIEEPSFSTLHEPDICFNYVGHTMLPDVALKYLKPKGKEAYGIIANENPTQYLLEINISVNEEKLKISFKSPLELYHGVNVDELANRYIFTLKKIIDQGKTILSSGLNKYEIEKIKGYDDPSSLDDIVEVF